MKATRNTGKGGTAGETPRDRLLALSPERQAQLLDPAEAEFAAHGFEAASLNRILAAADMSKGQAYYYVADKADLYRAVVERALGRLVARLDVRFPDPANADEFWAGIAAFLETLTVALQEDRRMAELGRSIYEGPQTQVALAEPMAQIRAEMARLVILGQSVGAVRDDLPQSLLVGVLFAAAREIDRWFAEHWQELSPDEALRLNAEALGLLRAIAAPPPANR